MTIQLVSQVSLQRLVINIQYEQTYKHLCLCHAYPSARNTLEKIVVGIHLITLSLKHENLTLGSHASSVPLET